MLSAAVGAAVAMVSLFVLIQEVWSGFSSEPMVPTVYRWSEQYLPTIGRELAIAVWGLASVASWLLVFGIYRNSKTRKEVVDGTTYQVTPRLAPIPAKAIQDAINTLQNAVKSLEVAPDIPLLPISEPIPAFECEADGNQAVLNIGEWVTIQFDRATLDLNADFHDSVFYAPDSGLYQFDLLIDLTSWAGDASNYEFRLVTSNRTYKERIPRSSLGERLPVRVSIVTDMDASDTAFYLIRQNGGRRTTGIKAGSFFRGRKIAGPIRPSGPGFSLSHTLIKSEEQGTWTPGFSFHENSDLDVAVADAVGNYWSLGKAWEIEGWLTVTLPDSVITSYAFVSGLPFALGHGTGQFSMDFRALDGSIRAANNGQLDGSLLGIIVPFSITDALLPNRTYRFHVSASYMEN